MRTVLAVSLFMVLTVFARAGEPTEVFPGCECRSSVPNWIVRLYPTGALKSCYLDRDQVIDGVPCAAGTREAENAARQRTTTVAAVFHPNGRLRQCQAAGTITIDDHSFQQGETVRLDEAGHVVAEMPALFAIVYPTLIRTEEGTAFDHHSRDVLAKAIEEQLHVPVKVSDRRLPFQMPSSPIQWQLFQAGIDSIGTQLDADAGEAEFHIVMEYLIARERRGGEAIAGIEYYVFDENAFGGWSAITTSDEPAFNRARLEVRSPRQHSELLARAAAFAAKETLSYLTPIARNWTKP